MPIRDVLFVALLFTQFAAAQTTLLTQKELCKRFMPSVVRIDAAADKVATGFIVTADGWILTVAHVLFDDNGEPIKTITVHLSDGSLALAKVFLEKESVARDFALLKVDKAGLAPLELGAESEVSEGSDIAIIGYPFSAGTQDKILPTKFCLAGMVAATEIVAKNGVNNVDVIYFQGPAVKGLSGAPIISRDSGHVVAIQTAKLAGIGDDLDRARKSLKEGPAPGVTTTFQIGGTDVGRALIGIVETLDRHLANGL